MKIITEDECKRRLENPKNILPKLKVKPFERNEKTEVQIKKLHNGGRRKGSTQIPSMLREIVGTAAQFDKAKNVAETFGISTQEAYHLKEGMRSSNKPDPELRDKIDRNIGVIKDRALEKLMDAMGAITTDEIQNAKLLEKSAVAKDMASIMEKVSDKSEAEDHSNQIHFHIYGPNLKSEEDFEVIDIAAKPVK